MKVVIIKNLHDQMEIELQQIRETYSDPAERAEHAIPIVQHCLLDLRRHIVDYPFKWRSEEVWFFKYVKPAVMSEMIFYTTLFNYSRNSPILREYKRVKDFWYCELREIRRFFETNAAFCEYIALDKEWLDSQFFVRKPGNAFFYFGLPKELDAVSFYGDPEFSTSHDYRAAKLQAFVRLEKFVRRQLEKVERIKYLPPQIKPYKGDDDFASLIWYKVGTFLKTAAGKAASQDETIEYLDESIEADLNEEAEEDSQEDDNIDEDLSNTMQSAIEQLTAQIDAEMEDVEYENDEEAFFEEDGDGYDETDEEDENEETDDQGETGESDDLIEEL